MIKNDMLVNLLKIEDLAPLIEKMRREGIIIRRANPWEISLVREFAVKEFSVGWADEISVGYTRQPISVFIAIREEKVVGFAAYECTRRNYFGPTGVADTERGKGIGKVLLLAALHGLREMGYAYAIIGSAESPEYYAKTAGAVEIENSQPGVYTDLIGQAGTPQL
jgi:predicted N-acetyltransferase YhbS